MRAAASDQRRVAVVGAPGAVGSQIVELLIERGFPFSELKLFASPESAESSLEFNDQSYPIYPLSDPTDLSGFEVAFLAVPSSAASAIVRARPGPLLIDLSAAGRAPSSGIPIAAPALTSRERMIDLGHQPLIATPHPAAEVIAGIIKMLDLRSSVVCATLMLSASSRGKAEVADLISQSADLLNARLDVEDDQTQIAFNLFADEQEAELTAAISAQVEELLGYRAQLLLRVVRMPVLHGAGLSILVPAAAGAGSRDKLSAAPGILLLEDEDPAGVIDAMSQEAICVSAKIEPAGVALWCVFDNARRAALSAIWIVESAMPGNSTMIN